MRKRMQIQIFLFLFAFVALVLPDGSKAATTKRYEETNPAITYEGIWSHASDPNAGGGGYKYSNVSGASASFTFTGSAVSWISDVWSDLGIASVYIDGVLDATVDLYRPYNLYMQVVYSKSGLPEGTHSLRIEVTGTKNSMSHGTLIDIDAFSFAPAVLNGHDVVLDENGKIVSWVLPQHLAYDHVMKSGWNFLINDLPKDLETGLKYYYLYSKIDMYSLEPVNHPHNPAGLYAMLTESALAYYAYSGDVRVIDLAKGVLDYHLAHGMTPEDWHWANVPYASSDPGSPEYRGCSCGDNNGSGDGTGVIEPDKLGELGIQFLKYYEFTGDVRYLDAAINSADALAGHIRPGNATQSPWPFRVYARTNVIREEYTSHVIAPINLFDELLRLKLGNIESYQIARESAWTWLMSYPMQSNMWANYFEDIPVQPDLRNLNQYPALETARYLLQHAEFDPDWQTHVSGIIRWVEETLGYPDYFGATPIGEQALFNLEMGSHTSRYASINALFHEKTGDVIAREKAYRAFNWATYMAQSNGRIRVGPQYYYLWFSDGYGDYIRHFMSGLGAVPGWGPSGQDHLLRSSSVVKAVSYTSSVISYTTFDPQAIEVLRLFSYPLKVTADGVPLPIRQDLEGEGWVYDSSTGIVRIRHDKSTNITIDIINTNDPPSVPLPPSGPTAGISSENYTFSTSASDPEGHRIQYAFDWGDESFTLTGLVPSGSSVNASHSWATAGIYNIRVVAKDEYGVASEWSSAPAVMTISEPVTIFHEETSPQVTYTGNWASISDVNASGGGYRYTSDIGATAIFTFKGAGISWISDVWSDLGIARVYLDGVLDATIDLYNPGNLYKQVVYRRDGLDQRTHTLIIEVTGTKNPASAGTLIDIDAFLIIPHPDTTPPTGSVMINEGDVWTNATSVTLNPYCTDDPDGSGCMEMQISNDGIFDTEPFEPIIMGKFWILPSGDGTKKVYVRYKDWAGNLSSIYSDGIDLDTTRPVVSSVSDTPDPFRPHLGEESTINFAISDNLSGGCIVVVRIVNSSGIMVRRIVTTGVFCPAPGAGDSITWDGRDSKGTIVSAGTYIYGVQVRDRALNWSLPRRGTISVE